MSVIHVCANPKPTEESVSKQLAASFFTKLVTTNPDIEVINVDLCSEAPPEYTYEEYRKFHFPIDVEGYVPTKEEEAAAEYAVAQAQQLLQADALVLTMPMWHYSVPGVLKTWLDHVLSPGLLYEKAHDVVTPKHKLKRVVLLVASGEAFKEGDARDAITPMITTAFEDIGVEEISMAWADGQNNRKYMDSDTRKEYAVEAAEEIAEEIAEELSTTVGI